MIFSSEHNKGEEMMFDQVIKHTNRVYQGEFHLKRWTYILSHFKHDAYKSRMEPQLTESLNGAGTILV